MQVKAVLMELDPELEMDDVSSRQNRTYRMQVRPPVRLSRPNC